MAIGPTDRELEQLLHGFEAEAAEHLEVFGQVIVELAEADAAARAGLIGKAFRAAHSIKGGSSMLQLQAATDLADAMETVLAEVRESQRKLSARERALLLESGDALLSTVRALVAKRRPPDTSGIIARLQGRAGSEVSEVTARERSGEDDHTLRVDLARLDAMSAQAGDLLVARAHATRRAVESRELIELADSLSAALARSQQTGEVELKLLDKLARGVKRLERALVQDASRVGLVTTGIIAAMQTIRLVTITAILGVVRRTVHEAALRAGKQVDLTISGGENTEFDKQVLDALKDPLVHLLRNAIDHGIEPAEERVRAGKNAKGQLQLRIEPRGGRVAIELSDDGRGVDIEALKGAAVRSGLRTQVQVDALGPKEALDLMALPGLSTREKSGELSGRGVGLDVVKQNVEQLLHGSLSIESTPGQGTTFSILVPLNVATVRVLVVEIDGHDFAVLSSEVEQVGQLQGETLVQVEGRLSLRRSNGQYLELIDLGGRLNLTRKGSRRAAMVISGGNQQAAFAVDSIRGELEVVFKPIQPPLKQLGATIGGAVIAGDEPLVILGGSELIRTVGRTAVVLEVPGQTRRKLKVLVVDDSVTTRTLETNILSKQGCLVTTATDGQEALRSLHRELPDIIVTDIEMPTMDGLELCRAIRNDPRLASLPIVLVTSLSAPEERAAGLNAGADAYIEKSKFDQEEFLALLNRLGDGR